MDIINRLPDIVIITIIIFYIITNIFLSKLAFTNLEEKKVYNKTELILARIAIIIWWLLIIILLLFIFYSINRK